MSGRKRDVIAQHLRKNIDVLDSTFEKYDLEVLSVGISHVDDYGWFQVVVEILKKNSGKLGSSLDIKANCYDEEGIIFSESTTIFNQNFSGYDTFIIYCQEDNLIYKTNKIRVFVVKHINIRKNRFIID